MAEGKKSEGNQAFKARDYAKAIICYTEAIEADPNSDIAALCLSNRSAAYFGLKEWDKAAEDAKKCVALKPTFGKGYYRLAVAMKKKGLLKDALDICKEGLKVSSEDASLKKLKASLVKKLKMEALTGGGGGGGERSSGGGASSTEKVQAVQKELNELSKQHQTYRSKLLTLKHEQDNSTKKSKLAEICAKNLEAVSKESKTYVSCGKMFLRSTRADTDAMLKSIDVEEQKNRESIGKQILYNQKKLKEAESNIQELLKSVGAKPVGA